MSWSNSKSQAFWVLAALISLGGPTFGSRLPLHVERERIDEIVRRFETVEQHSNKLEQPELRHDLDVPIMIAREGYPVETHTVVTEDCYILEMHRIPHGKNNAPTGPGDVRPAVYLQHGLLCSSADWVMGIPEKSLGYILADEGYDVWLGNYRGNYYSREHCELNPNKEEFWHFSWDEMGKYDIPAMVDKVISATGHQKIHYVGHSMGTTGFMVTMNKRPEYAEKIMMANLLAPVAFVEHMKSPIRLIAPFVDEIEWIADFLGLGEFLPSSGFMDLIADIFCDGGWLQGICESVLFLMCGFDEAQVNETLLDTIIHHTPAGASTFTVIHYAQEVNSGGFNAYDFGKEDNQEIYGSDHPPPYSLADVTVPVSLYWGQNDWLAQPADILTLLTRLPNVYDNYEVPYPNWNHLDFLWGIDANTLVYPQVISNMARAEAEFGGVKS
ncbi:hypothetical protein TCAL_06993 [Tigriopus californicus]|uniref:Partial AB-hydrolase lipase domain-containing protein n=1 Tax=Tigriopus californicus TaxID=6832 RepID=A0A553P6Y7_TIGCA|nr:lipase 3-like [Tigriopus californicus]TRY73442.1 hypothetical protein TCAL_06993 [Tigriopus californicus]